MLNYFNMLYLSKKKLINYLRKISLLNKLIIKKTKTYTNIIINNIILGIYLIKLRF